MDKLSTKVCTACRPDAPQATPEQRQQYLQQLPEWSIETVEGVDQLAREHTFNTYEQAVSYANNVATLAMHVNHHPSILIAYKTVKVSWWTHKIKGLHVNDFIMAAKCDDELEAVLTVG